MYSGCDYPYFILQTYSIVYTCLFCFYCSQCKYIQPDLKLHLLNTLETKYTVFMSANVNLINCSFNMYSCFFHFHEYTHHVPIICWLLSRILISSAHYNTEVFSDLTLPFKLLDSFPVLVSNILHRIRIKCCIYVCMYVCFGT